MTNQPKHTPGPWSAIRPFGTHDYNIWARSVEGRLPVVVGHAVDAMSLSVDENNANARLIAAAPELLEALKAISKECADTPSAVSEAALGLIQILAREAIAKAEGK